MSYLLIVRPEAEKDITNATIWYEDQKEGLGSRFIDALDEKLTVIKSNPYKYQIRFRDTRFAFLKHFPFAIHFIIEDSIIFVLAVLSTHRNPQIWK